MVQFGNLCLRHVIHRGNLNSLYPFHMQKPFNTYSYEQIIYVNNKQVEEANVFTAYAAMKQLESV